MVFLKLDIGLEMSLTVSESDRFSLLLLCLLLVSCLCVHHGCELGLNVLDLRLKSLLIGRSLVLCELLRAFCTLVMMNVLTRKLV